MEIAKLKNGIVINGVFPRDDVRDAITVFVRSITGGWNSIPLIIADPAYGKIVNSDWDNRHEKASDMVNEMIGWTNVLADFGTKGGALYVWGGYGIPGFRPYYKYLTDVEDRTPWRLAIPITWSKKRAYGVSHNYLSTREELAYFVLGDIKKPKIFNIPLLDQKRGYAGYNPEYPAKSEFYRRTCVWTDITEILRDKLHECQKPEKVYDIPIEIHTNKGDIVLDPFAGSGTCGASAARLGRKYILVEELKSNFDICVKRLKSMGE